MQRFHVLRVLRAALFAVALSPLAAASADWKPDTNVEIVIPSGSGSGLDATGRTLQRYIQENKLLPVTSAVVNRAGGGGTLAYLYVNQHPNNAHYLSITSPGVITNKIVGASNSTIPTPYDQSQISEQTMASSTISDRMQCLTAPWTRRGLGSPIARMARRRIQIEIIANAIGQVDFGSNR